MHSLTPAGERDRKISFFKNATVKSGSGAMTKGDPVAIAAPWGKVNYGTGAERRRAGSENSLVGATVRVLKSAATLSIDSDHFCTLDGATWNVTGNVPWGRRERDITIVRRG